MNYRYSVEDYKLLYKKSKYSIDVTKKLYELGSITHQKLSDSLNIKKNNLSNIMRKLEPFEIVETERIGKNVFYSLSAKGYEFFEYIEARNKKEEIKNQPVAGLEFVSGR